MFLSVISLRISIVVMFCTNEDRLSGRDHWYSAIRVLHNELLYVLTYFPSKHKTFVQHIYNVGPTSSTLVQHSINIIQMFCACWVRQHSRKLSKCFISKQILIHIVQIV